MKPSILKLFPTSKKTFGSKKKVKKEEDREWLALFMGVHCEDGSPTVSCMKKIVCGYGGLWKFGTKRGLSQNSTLFFSYFSTKLATCFDFLFLFILTNLVRVHVRRCQKLWLGETTNCIPLYRWCQNWTVCWDCRKM